MKMDFRDFKMMLMFFLSVTINLRSLVVRRSFQLVRGKSSPFFFLLENISLLKRLAEPSPHEHTIWFLLVENEDR